MLTAKQIEDILESFSYSEPYIRTIRQRDGQQTNVPGHYDYQGWDGFLYLLSRNAVKSGAVEVEGVGSIRKIEYVGGEGEGDYMHVVMEITDRDGNVRLFKKQGRWVSYDGAYWDDGSFHEVVPTQKMITVYERKAN